MARRATFVEVFEAALETYREEAHRAARPGGVATEPFLFLHTPAPLPSAPATRAGRPIHVAADVMRNAQRALQGLSRPPAARPARPLAPRQQAALDDIVALGAHLGPDFTLAELRSAFRRLAREFHPDRHAGQGAIERAHLSRLFADLTDNYRCLLALSESKR